MTCWGARCGSPTTCRIKRSPTPPPPASCRRSTTASTGRRSPPPTSTAAPSTPCSTCWAARCSQVGATGLTHTTIYDDAAHTITKSVIPDGATDPQATRTTSYDNGNRPVTVQRDYNDGTVDPTQAAAFDGLGRVTSQTSDDVTLEYSYLGAGGASTTQTATPQDPATFPGDPLDLSNTVALGGQQTSSSRQAPDGTAFEGTGLTYDPAARIATSTDPNGRITSYTYYPDGRVATRTTPSGTVVTDTYDATTGRLVNVTAQPSTGPSVSHTYTYVPAGEPGAGRVHTISDGTNTVTLAYDADGHVVSRGYSDGTATSATYTDTGLLATTTDVTGAVTTYHYDDAGRMTTVTQTRGDTTLAEVTYTYDSMSRIATTTRGNGITTTNTWTPRNQLATQRTTNASGAADRGPRLHLRPSRQRRPPHRHPPRRTEPDSRHLDHRLPLRRLQPAARFGRLPGGGGVGDAVEVDDLHPQHRR